MNNITIPYIFYWHSFSEFLYAFPVLWRCHKFVLSAYLSILTGSVGVPLWKEYEVNNSKSFVTSLHTNYVFLTYQNFQKLPKQRLLSIFLLTIKIKLNSISFLLTWYDSTSVPLIFVLLIVIHECNPVAFGESYMYTIIIKLHC